MQNIAVLGGGVCRYCKRDCQWKTQSGQEKEASFPDAAGFWAYY